MGGTMTKLSPFAEALANQPKPDKGPTCSVCIALSEMDPADVEIAEQAMADRRRTAPQIEDAFGVLGHHLGQGAVARHRNRQCKAFR